jgi:hypothetical protein
MEQAKEHFKGGKICEWEVDTNAQWQSFLLAKWNFQVLLPLS